MQPVFVVGVPRSGTTLLRSALSAHPNITIAPETSLLSYWYRRYGWLDLNSAAGFEYFWRMFTQSYAFAHLALSEADARARIRASSTVNFRAVFTVLLQMYAEAKGKGRWGEKTPRHHRYLDVLLDWYPDARIIYLIRDPRSICASAAKTPWGTRVPHVYAREWQDAEVRIRQPRYHGRVLGIRYEDMVVSTEQSLQTVCDFIGESFDASMIHGRSESDVISAADSGWHKEHLAATVRPITQGNIERWQTELSTAEVALIESICARGMERHGYVLRGDSARFDQTASLQASIWAFEAKNFGLATARAARDFLERSVRHRELRRRKGDEAMIR